jgi:hypothetical protein
MHNLLSFVTKRPSTKGFDTGTLSHLKQDINHLESYKIEHFYSGADTPIQLGPNILLEHITYS